jgi:SAM-dependent methyltransferase
MSNVSDYREYWQSIYRAAYAEGREHWRPELATPPAFAEFMRSSWPPPSGSRVLEAGCGDGLNAIRLAATGYIVTGVDISAEAIARAHEVAAGEGLEVEFLCMDLVHDDLTFDDKYDLWVDIKTLHCLWEDKDRRRYLARAADALCENGILFLNCALALADVREHFPEVFSALDPATQEQAGILDRELAESERQGIRCETLDWYCHELEQAGFAICEARREASIESGWGAIIIARKTI